MNTFLLELCTYSGLLIFLFLGGTTLYWLLRTEIKRQQTRNKRTELMMRANRLKQRLEETPGPA